MADGTPGFIRNTPPSKSASALTRPRSPISRTNVPPACIERTQPAPRPIAPRVLQIKSLRIGRNTSSYRDFFSSVTADSQNKSAISTLKATSGISLPPERIVAWKKYPRSPARTPSHDTFENPIFRVIPTDPSLHYLIIV